MMMEAANTSGTPVNFYMAQQPSRHSSSLIVRGSVKHAFICVTSNDWMIAV
jgi:hypothetical protein